MLSFTFTPQHLSMCLFQYLKVIHNDNDMPEKGKLFAEALVDLTVPFNKMPIALYERVSGVSYGERRISIFEHARTEFTQSQHHNH